MRTSTWIRTAAVAAAIGLCAGCNSRDASNLSADTKSLAQHTGQALSSASLAAKVNGVLSVWKGVDMSTFHVEAQDGVVRLVGKARNRQERHEILGVLSHIRGIDRIDSSQFTAAK